MLPKLTDREIEEACRLLSAYEVATIPPEDTYTDIRSADYTAYMDDLIAKSEAGVLRAPDVPMGWQYYTRKAVAAALIAALLAGIAMPERVMAGYRWLVEVVEQFFEDRKTTYLYISNIDEGAEFVPMQFGYLPEGMECEVKENNKEENILKILCWRTLNGKYEYFEIEQKLLKADYRTVKGSNLEVFYTDTFVVNGEIVKYILNDNKISFQWLQNVFLIDGKTNLSKEELLKILSNISFEQSR